MRIEVRPPTVAEAARQIPRAHCARAARAALAAANPTVTGSAELSAALAEHARVWGWALDHVQERLENAAAALEAAASAYDRAEQRVTAIRGPPH